MDLPNWICRIDIMPKWYCRFGKTCKIVIYSALNRFKLNRKKTFKDQMLVLYYSRNTYNTYKNLDFSYKCPYSMHQISITSLRTQFTNTKKGLSIILNVPSTYHLTVLFRHFICSSVIKIKWRLRPTFTSPLKKFSGILSNLIFKKKMVWVARDTPAFYSGYCPS